jgi:hypothetical protein
VSAATIAFRVLPDLYKDSVTLMQIAAKLRGRDGVDEATCVMATPANLAQLADAGLAVDAGAAPSALLVVVRGDAAACAVALDAAEALLTASGAADAGDCKAFSLPASCLGVARMPEPIADLGPRRLRAAEAQGARAQAARDAVLRQRRSPRIAIRLTYERALLVMSPDCRTAIAGPSASPTSCVAATSGTSRRRAPAAGGDLPHHNGGGGVLQALSTGGRDSPGDRRHHDAAGLAMLAADPSTRVIVVIQPPAPSIAAAIATP